MIGKKEMEPVEVNFRYDEQGKIYPIEFYWKNQRYLITSVGRRWWEDTTLHIMVMATDHRVFELIFFPNEARWCINNKRLPNTQV